MKESTLERNERILAGGPRLKPKQRYLWLDQQGQAHSAATLKELKDKVGPGRVSKMYQDSRDGEIACTGYVIGHRWLSRYIRAPLEENVEWNRSK